MAGANAITGILHGKHVHLEQIPDDCAERVAEAQILCIGVEIDDNKPGVTKRQEQARYLLAVGARNEDQLLGEALDCVRWLGSGKA